MLLRFVQFITETLSYLLSFLLRARKYPSSVLHIGYMVHIPYYTTRLLRKEGYRADYLAIGKDSNWDKADYVFGQSWEHPVKRRWKEFVFFWKVMAKYEILHAHIMMTLSEDGWEMKHYKRMGRKLVAHYRGCEGRDRERNMELHPEVNICQQCDYDPMICKAAFNVIRRGLEKKYADHVYVTTPDMKDFNPNAEHLPFLSPVENQLPEVQGRQAGDTFRIVHLTNHPGIEGTAAIEKIIQELKAEGLAIEFDFLRGVSNEEALKAFSQADLSIGKMKMGYYANAQIESMYMGVPTITYVREEFMTEEIKNSGLIISSLSSLKETIRHYFNHPEELAQKRAIARSSIARLHDNEKIVGRMIDIYQKIRKSGNKAQISLDALSLLLK